MKSIVCICDREPEYTRSFVECVNMHKTFPYEVLGFTDPSLLVEYLNKGAAEVLLISPEFYDAKVQKQHVPHIFLLAEGNRSPSKWSLPQINKYQKVDRILEKILLQTEPECALFSVENPRILGIYSPIHRIGKTTFALALCQELSRERKVLYINLEDVSGFEPMFGEMYESDLTDLLYYARQSREKFALHLTVIAREMQGISYIPPARVPMELKAVGLSEWKEFLELLRQSGLYEIIVLDLGDGLQNLPELLTCMDRIYMPVTEDRVSQSKLRQYEDMLEIMDYTDVLENTRKLSLPAGNLLREGGSYLTELQWGPMTGYVREMVEGEIL